MGDEVWVGWAEAFGALEAARLVGEVAREVEAAAVAAVASAVGRLEEACAVRVVRGGVFFLPWVALAPIEEAGRGPAREGVKRRRLRLRPRRDLPDQLATPSSRRHLPPDVGKGKKKAREVLPQSRGPSVMRSVADQRAGGRFSPQGCQRRKDIHPLIQDQRDQHLPGMKATRDAPPPSLSTASSPMLTSPWEGGCRVPPPTYGWRGGGGGGGRVAIRLGFRAR